MRFPLMAWVVLDTTLKRIFLVAGAFFSGGRGQENSRTRMRPSFKRDFGCFPGGTLIEFFRIGIVWIPGTVEPVEIGLVVGDPFLNRLPGWFGSFHGLDIEGQWWWTRDLGDTFHFSLKRPTACPETVEAVKKLDFLAADDLANRFYCALAAGALERIGSPDFKNEVAPEGAHGTGALLRRGGDEEDLQLMIVDFGLSI